MVALLLASPFFFTVSLLLHPILNAYLGWPKRPRGGDKKETDEGRQTDIDHFLVPDTYVLPRLTCPSMKGPCLSGVATVAPRSR